MWPVIKETIVPFFSKFEGYVSHMYLDNKGLVTTGMGDLIDPVSSALDLPWKHADSGSPATREEIQSAWRSVKDRQDKKEIGGGQTFWSTLNDLRLDDSAIKNLINAKLDGFETILRSRFPGWDHFPAPAQLGILSMAWAMGPKFNYPHFQAAVNQVLPDWNKAADESYIPDNPEKNPDLPPTSNPGLRPRNIANKLLFQQAADTQKSGANPANLDLPGLGQVASAGIHEAIGVPNFILHKTGKWGWAALGGSILAGLGALFAGLKGGRK